jgi:hypothetical protein
VRSFREALASPKEAGTAEALQPSGARRNRVQINKLKIARGVHQDAVSTTVHAFVYWPPIRGEMPEKRCFSSIVSSRKCRFQFNVSRRTEAASSSQNQ